MGREGVGASLGDSAGFDVASLNCCTFGGATSGQSWV